MPRSEKQESTTPAGESASDRYVREHPGLIRDPHPELAEGETELIFIAPPQEDEGQE